MAAPLAALAVFFGFKKNPDLIIRRVQIVARPRKLAATWTIEKQQDLRALHGLDAEAELANILSSEIENGHKLKINDYLHNLDS